MKKEDLGPLTYSPEDVLNLTERNLENQITDALLEKTLLDGKIEALRNTLNNLKYMRNHRQ